MYRDLNLETDHQSVQEPRVSRTKYKVNHDVILDLLLSRQLVFAQKSCSIILIARSTAFTWFVCYESFLGRPTMTGTLHLPIHNLSDSTESKSRDQTIVQTK